MKSTRILLAAVAALLLGCTLPGEIGEPRIPCTNDAQCGGDQVCFPDGCGDPGKDIVVEIVPGAASGQLAQDFEVEKIAPSLDFQAFAPPVIQGVLAQGGETGSEVAYNGEVTIRASGESLLIPGRSRTFQYTVQPDQGAYQIPVATGRYTVTFTPSEPVLPPRISHERFVTPGEVHELNNWFPLISSLLRIDGRLVKTAAENVAIQSTVMEVQAFDPLTQLPLSQRMRVSSGQTTSTGDFFLYVEKQLGIEEIHLKATPRDAQAMVPTKTFVVPLNTKMSGPLEMGEFGTPVTVTGRIVDSAGHPVGAAVVFLEGEVGGGGTFRTQRGSTDETGSFTLTTLPSAMGGTLKLVAVPPPDSSAGLVRAHVQVTQQGGELGDFAAPDKVVVMGSLLRPDGDPASGVVVRAEPVAKLDDHPLPSASTEVTTDETGEFSLRLAPAIYRLDFLPTDFYPRVSRFVTVRTTPGTTGEVARPIQLPEFQLSRGRTVTGLISSIPRQLSVTNEPLPAPNAAVKFFRVVTFEGKQSHVLLAEGLADSNGGYRVVLPTK